MTMNDVPYTSFIKNRYFSSSRSVSRKTLFGAVFVVSVIIYFYINMKYSDYYTKIDYFLNYDDDENTNPSMEAGIGYLLSNDESYLGSIDNHFNIGADEIGIHIYTNDEDKTEANNDDINLTSIESNIDKTDGENSEANIGGANVENTNSLIKVSAEETHVGITTNESTHSNTKGRNAVNMFVDMISIEKSSANIFFLETRCATKKARRESYQESRSFMLNARQSCAVESTARMNPDRPVYVFHSCQLDDDFVATSAPYVGRLMNYENVHVVRLLPEQVFHDTPLKPMVTRGELEESAFPVQHASDLVRLALLWKFGGTYLDLDIISMKSLTPLGNNWFTAESDGAEENGHMTGISNAILNVEPVGEAHEVIYEAMTYLNEHYDKTRYADNGPFVITETVLKHCQVQSVPDAVNSCRANFTLLPKSYCFPVYWPDFGDFFDETFGPSLASRLKEGTYVLHTWNRQSKERVARVGSQQAYSLLAEEFCPEVYANCGENF